MSEKQVLWGMKMSFCALVGFWDRKGEREAAQCAGHQQLFPSWPEDGAAVAVIFRDVLASLPAGFSGFGLCLYTKVLHPILDKTQ